MEAIEKHFEDNLPSYLAIGIPSVLVMIGLLMDSMEFFRSLVQKLHAACIGR